jgi:hypothetical protein
MAETDTAKPVRRAKLPRLVIGHTTGSLVAALNAAGESTNTGRCPQPWVRLDHQTPILDGNANSRAGLQAQQFQDWRRNGEHEPSRRLSVGLWWAWPWRTKNRSEKQNVSFSTLPATTDVRLLQPAAGETSLLNVLTRWASLAA